MKKRDEIIWNNVLFLAAQKGWNKTELAKRVGTNTSVLNNIKDGTRGIGNRLLKKFADTFNKDEAELLRESDKTEKTQSGSTSQGDDRLLNMIMARLEDLADRIKRQGNALELTAAKADSAKNDTADIYKRLTDYADSKDVRKLKKVG